MRIRIRILLATVLGTLALSSAPARQDEAPKKAEPRKSLVARKLENAHKVLDGVAKTDYQEVERSAEELIKIAKALTWEKARSERYEELGTEYRRDLEGLIKAARTKSNEAMALAYVRVSLSCFKCHNEVREWKLAGDGR